MPHTRLPTALATSNDKPATALNVLVLVCTHDISRASICSIRCSAVPGPWVGAHQVNGAGPVRVRCRSCGQFFMYVAAVLL